MLVCVSHSFPSSSRNWCSSVAVNTVCWVYVASCSIWFQFAAADWSVNPPTP